MIGDWINAWPLLLILAAGIALGRWAERHQQRKRMVRDVTRETAAVIRRAMERA